MINLNLFKLFSMIALGISLNSYASTIPAVNVQSVDCLGANSSDYLSLDTIDKTAAGEFLGLSFTNDLSGYDDVEDMDQIVEFFPDFLSSGIDLIAGLVVTTDLASFGTLGLIVQNGMVKSGDQFDVVYVEGMTGRTFNLKMSCTFK